MSTGSLVVDAIDLLAAVGLILLAGVIGVVVRAGIREWRDDRAHTGVERR